MGRILKLVAITGRCTTKKLRTSADSHNLLCHPPICTSQFIPWHSPTRKRESERILILYAKVLLYQCQTVSRQKYWKRESRAPLKRRHLERENSILDGSVPGPARKQLGFIESTNKIVSIYLRIRPVVGHKIVICQYFRPIFCSVISRIIYYFNCRYCHRFVSLSPVRPS